MDNVLLYPKPNIPPHQEPLGSSDVFHAWTQHSITIAVHKASCRFQHNATCPETSAHMCVHSRGELRVAQTDGGLMKWFKLTALYELPVGCTYEIKAAKLISFAIACRV
jgi:hypothetical protein